MRKRFSMILVAALCLPLVFACQKAPVVPGEPDPEAGLPAFPKPVEQIAGVPLTRAEKDFVTAGNRFAWTLTQKVWALNENGQSMIISPLSVQYALGMVGNGADADVAQKLAAVLGYEGVEAINAFCAKLIESLPAVDTSVTLALANGVLVDERYPLKAPFRSAVEEAYHALVTSMSFADPGAVMKYVNDWCNRHTYGRIPEVLKQVDPQAFMYLMNAIYFHAGWALPFEKAETRSEDFKTASGTVKVPMMHKKLDALYGESKDCESLNIPYGNGRYLMTVYLPKGNTGVAALLEAPQTLLPTPGETCHVVLSLPSFRTDSEVEMLGLLAGMGLPVAPYNELVVNAPFPPGISRVIHKANITVNESGSEAAAVTVIEMKFTSAGPDAPKEPRTIIFTADHPFLYTIWEATSGVILFTGVYSGN